MTTMPRELGAQGLLSLAGLFIYFKYFIYLFLETGEGREKERERTLMFERHTSSVASHMPPAGDLARNQACTLTGNRTGDLSVGRLALNPLSHTSNWTI